MNIKEAIENSPVIFFLGAIVSGFVAGISSVAFFFEFANLEVIQTQELVSLRNSLEKVKNERQNIESKKNNECPPCKTQEVYPEQEYDQSKNPPNEGSIVRLPKIIRSKKQDNFVFNLVGCYRIGTREVDCKFIIKNDFDQGRILELRAKSHSNSRIVDSDLDVYDALKVQLGNEIDDRRVFHEFIPMGELKATFSFIVPSKVKTIKSFEVLYSVRTQSGTPNQDSKVPPFINLSIQ